MRGIDRKKEQDELDKLIKERQQAERDLNKIFKKIDNRQIYKGTFVNKNRRLSEWDKANEFYKTDEWKQCRKEFIESIEHFNCNICGTDVKDNKLLNVDHIIPIRSNFKLRLDLTNLQILCLDCNKAKGSALNLTNEEIQELSDDNRRVRLGMTKLEYWQVKNKDAVWEIVKKDDRNQSNRKRR